MFRLIRASIAPGVIPICWVVAMSSEALCKLAYSIGYRPSDRKLTADSVEWMFLQNDACKGFLDWFCTNISQDNIISDAQIQEYVATAYRGATIWNLNTGSDHLF